MSVCLCGQCLEDSSSHYPFLVEFLIVSVGHLEFACIGGGSPKPRHMYSRTWFSRREISVLGRTRCGFPRPKPGNFLDMIFRRWDPQFLETWSLHSGFPRPKKTWEILGYGFQDMVFRTWDLNFGAWICTLAVSKTKTWKLLGCDFQDVGSQFWHMIFKTWMGNQATSQCPKVTGTH